MRNAILVAAACCLAGGGLFAHEGATGVVKARMDMMKEMGADLKRLTAISRGEAPYDADEVSAIGDAYLRHGGHFPDMFPAGSDKPPSEAAPAIWSERDRFNALWSDMSRSIGTQG